MSSISGNQGNFESSMAGRSQKASKWFQKGLNIYPDKITENVLIGTKTNTDSKKFVVVGDSKFDGSIEHTGNFDVDGNLSVEGTTLLKSETTLQSTLNVSDTTTVTSLICNNTATFNRLATFEYPVVMNSTLNVSDTTHLTALTTTGETKINGGLLVIQARIYKAH